MKLEYLPDTTAGGKYLNAWPAQLIRLYDFDALQHQQLLKLLQQWLAGNQPALALGAASFITPVNCQLTLRLALTEQGIRPAAAPACFTCELTRAGFLQLIEAMRPVGEGYAWLDNLSASPIEFLYSPGGGW